tara:strand:- start:435 stop:614 length:180 start_codon:yes stop_codon:yes gene_type:complete
MGRQQLALGVAVAVLACLPLQGLEVPEAAVLELLEGQQYLLMLSPEQLTQDQAVAVEII